MMHKSIPYASFDVYENGSFARSFCFSDASLLIGRSASMRLQLPDVSVSRRHVRIDRNGGGWSFVDLSSTNGILHNGSLMRKGCLRAGDWLQVGDYLLLFNGTSPLNEHLGWSEPIMSSKIAPPSQENKPSPSLAIARQLVSKAALASEDEEFNWILGERSIMFGGVDGIPIDDTLSGYLALIVWDGSSHFIQKISTSIQMKINGIVMDEKTLTLGDELSIGNNSFQYHIDGGLLQQKSVVVDGVGSES